MKKLKKAKVDALIRAAKDYCISGDEEAFDARHRLEEELNDCNEIGIFIAEISNWKYHLTRPQIYSCLEICGYKIKEEV